MSYKYVSYPNKPIGRGNPYWCCSSCGLSDPQINGRPSRHRRWCEWRINRVTTYLQTRRARAVTTSKGE